VPWLIVLCVVVFARGLSGDFVMDDWPVIQDNSKITEMKYIPGYFSRGVWANTDLAEQAGLSGTTLYRPLFLLTLNAAHHLWSAIGFPEKSALGYHLLNLSLHSINTVLLFFLIVRLLPTSGNGAALLGTALFAVHPVHVESIAWIAGLTDPLVSFFLLGSMLCYHRYATTGHTGAAILALLGYAAGLLSKEVAVFFPLLIMAHDRLLAGRFHFRRYLPYAVLLVVYFIARSTALNGTDWSRFDVGNWSLLLEFTARYLQLLFLPWPLEYYYDPPATSFFSLIIGGGILLVALIALPGTLRRGHALPAFALSWCVVTLLPALPIALMDPPVFATRVLYLPSVSVALFAAWLYTVAGTRRQPFIAASVTVTMVFAVISITEIADWRDDKTFYARATQTSPQSFRPYAGLARTWEREGDSAQAIESNLKAAALAGAAPNQLDFLESAARLYGQGGDIAASERLYHEIVQRAPRRSSAWVGLGNNALARRQLQAALNYYQRAYQADSRNAVASYNLAIVHQNLGNLERARYYQRITQALQGQQ
jgi:tetratricopeptide (TPR) repeat protein